MNERAKTIDASGNVIAKPYGASRWSSPRVRECKHDECTNAAVILSTDHGRAHNCCGDHGLDIEPVGVLD